MFRFILFYGKKTDILRYLNVLLSFAYSTHFVTQSKYNEFDVWPRRSPDLMYFGASGKIQWKRKRFRAKQRMFAGRIIWLWSTDCVNNGRYSFDSNAIKYQKWNEKLIGQKKRMKTFLASYLLSAPSGTNAYHTSRIQFGIQRKKVFSFHHSPFGNDSKERKLVFHSERWLHNYGKFLFTLRSLLWDAQRLRFLSFS